MYNTAWLGRAGSSQLAGLRACLDKGVVYKKYKIITFFIYVCIYNV